MDYSSVFLLIFLSVFTGTQGLNEVCDKNTDCDKNTKGAICINGQCNCDQLSYYNKTQCLPCVINDEECVQLMYATRNKKCRECFKKSHDQVIFNATEYGALCQEAAQCEWLGENAVCTYNRCVCKKSFRWYKGKCRPYVDKGEKCDSDDDCYNGYDLLSLTCQSGVCACNQGYYDRGYDCRKSSTWLVDDDCALNIDCKSSLVPFVCTLGKCGENKTKNDITLTDLTDLFNDDESEEDLTLYSYLRETISCVNDEDCKDIANSLCDTTNGTCACNAKTHYLYNGNCVLGFRECSSDDDCDVSNTMCFKNTTCLCKQGFFLQGQQCIAELGTKDSNTSYSQDSDCPIKPGKLVDSTCYCKNYWFNDDANRNCIKTMIQSTKSCLTNDWCYAMGPYAFCDSTSSRCACAHFATFNESTYYCDPTGEPKAGTCLRDGDCKINEYCLDEKCECVKNFARNDANVCLPDIGASCLTTGCSHIGNASCAGGLCECPNNYIGKVNRCLIIAEKLYDNCEEQEQCHSIEHAVCGICEEDEEEEEETVVEKCICGEEYTAVSDKCYQSRKFGDPCTTESDCTLVLNHSYQCRNSICQCAVGQKLKNGYCTSSSVSSIGASAKYILILLVALVRLGVS